PGRRRQPVRGRFAVAPAALARALGVARPAEDLPLAGEADRSHARDDAREAARDRHRRLLDRARHETAVEPALAHPAEVEPVRFGDAVVVDAERPSEGDRHAIDVGARETSVVERGLQRLRAELQLTVGEEAAVLALPDADDRRLIADRESHVLSRWAATGSAPPRGRLRRASVPRP